MTLLSKILLGAASAVLLILISTVGVFWVANARLRADLAEARSAESLCRVANLDFADKVAAQNRAVDAIRSESKAEILKAQMAQAAAEKVAAAHGAAAQKLLARQDKGCAAAEAAVNAYVGR